MTQILSRASGRADVVTRSVALDDIEIDSDGDGRTVTALATVFNTPAEIVDAEGHYNEQIGRSAFTKTLSERGTKFGVFYNHGSNLHGQPAERYSMPLGVPLEIKADGARGLLTRTRYSKTDLADEVLEGIRNGAITGQSFSGRMITSTPGRQGRSRYAPAADGTLPLITRTEIAMIEYGPTPFPAYETATIDSVRASALSIGDSSLILTLLGQLGDAANALDPLVQLLSGSEAALLQTQAVLAEILYDSATATDEAGRSLHLRAQELVTRLAAVTTDTTPPGAGGTTLRSHQTRAKLIEMGLL